MSIITLGERRGRFRLRLNLRLFLLLVALTCVIIPWLKARKDLQRLRNERAQLNRDYVSIAGVGVQVDTSGDVTHAWLTASQLRTFLNHLGGQRVASLRIGDVGDDEVALLPNVKGLHVLTIVGAGELSENGLKAISHCSELEVLNLSVSIVEKGLEHFVQCQRLRALHLSYSNVDDAAIPLLKELGQLEVLSIDHTSISDDGYRALVNALPNCRVIR